jgi:localization factor PodJL
MKPAASLSVPEDDSQATTSAREAGPRTAATTTAGMAAAVMDWQANLQGAIAEIAARQRELDGEAPRQSTAAPPREQASRPLRAEDAAVGPSFYDMSRFEQQLRTITEQLESLRRPCATEEALAGLQRELAEFGRRLNDALPRNVLESFQSEIRALGERIEIGARQGADQEALSGIERGLADIRRSLDDLTPAENLGEFAESVQALSRKVEALGMSGPDPQTLQQLEQAVSQLRTVAAQIASGDAVAALAGQIRAIGDSLDRFTAEADRVVDIEQKGIEHVEQLAQRMETLAATIQSRVGEAAAGMPPQFTQLEERILLLAHKLDASEERLGSLSAIENNIADLMVQLKGARTAAIEAAESAARAVAREMLHARPAGADGEFAELRHDVAQLRSTQADIDRRTAGALESVHDTLKRLVDQMSSVDLSPRLPVVTRPDPEAVSLLRREPNSPSPPGSPPPALAAAPTDARPRSQAFVPAVPAPPRKEPEPRLPDDHPLEPGSGSPRRVAVTPAERIAASEAALAAAGPAQPQAPEPSSQANFIAAARRAAMAAAEGSSDSGGTNGASAARRLWAIGPTLLKWRRKLIIGTAVVVLTLGVLQLVNRMLHDGQEGADGPPRPQPEMTPPAPPDRGRSELPLPASPRVEEAGRPGPSFSALPPDEARLAGSGRQSQGPREPGSLLSPLPMMGTGAAAASGHSAGGHDVPGAKAVTVPDARGGTAGATREATATISRPPPIGESAPAARPSTAALPDKLPEAIGGPALRAAAAADDPAAQFEVAIRYAEGRGVPQSFEDAARWLERAASHGLAPAQFRLGSLYEKGQGVTKDLAAARRLYSAAAAKGNGKAMHNLAVMYAEGIDGKPDYQTAARWFRTAAEHGVADSQYNLAILYARGIGVEQDLAESYKWFSLAAQHGDNDAAKKRDDVATRVDPQALAAVRMAVETWTAEPQPDEATTVKPPAAGWDAAGSALVAPPRSHQVGTGRTPTPGSAETRS